jgi:hypothetical protein
MFSGGDYVEVGRWLRNFVTSHAKRENPRVEAVVEAEGPREGRSYGVRLELGRALRPPADRDPVELGFAEVASSRGSLQWCQTLAARVRACARALSAPGAASPRPS